MSKRILVAGFNSIDSDKFNRVANMSSGLFDDSSNKPSGGLWGSTYTPDERYPSQWVDWCVGDGYRVSDCYHGISFELRPDTRICEIRNALEYRKMMETYGKSRFSESDNAPKWGNVISIDWDKLSKDYDAFHLTEKAFYELRLPMTDILETSTGVLANFYSYDCESWILFNLDCIDQESVETHEFSFDDEY